jgi:probable HAF family extracellular repeat protein
LNYFVEALVPPSWERRVSVNFRSICFSPSQVLHNLIEPRFREARTDAKQTSNTLSVNFSWLIPSITAMFITAAANAAAYTFTQIDAPGVNDADNTQALGINDAGQIVGSFQIGSTDTVFGFIDTGGTFTHFEVPGSHYTVASGINGSSQIVGWFQSPVTDVSHGFLDTGGEFTQIDVPGADSNTLASGINNAGQIVGVFDNGTGEHGFLDTGGIFAEIDVPGAADGTEALGINDAGQIVGNFYDSGGNSHGFVETHGTFTQLNVPGASFTVAFGINDAGQIVGLFENSTGSHGFVDTDGNFKQIDVPGSTANSVYVTGINNRGQIVGSFQNSTDTHGFLATPNGMGSGDPHLTTFDSQPYNFYATGEFVLAQSTIAGNSFDVQIETRPWYAGSVASIISEVAAKLGNNIVTFDLDRANSGGSFVWIDGHPASLSADHRVIALAAGQIVEISPNDFQVIWDTGETLEVTDAGPCLDVTASLSSKDGPGSVEGLLGSDSGWDSDFQLPNGTILDPQISTSELDSVFADAWRVTDATSLFDAMDVPEPPSLSILIASLIGLAIALSLRPSAS